MHEEEAALSADRHEAVKATVIATVTKTKEEHETTRREVAIRAATGAAEMRVYMVCAILEPGVPVNCRDVRCAVTHKQCSNGCEML